MSGSEHDPDQAFATPNDQVFNTTHWSVVLAAGQTSAPGAQEAMEKLCRTYWYPLYAYVRRKGHSTHDAQDLTQAFFATVLETNLVQRADPELGKFRSFLLTGLKNFLANEWDRAQAQKRGGKHIVISLDDNTAEDKYCQEPASGFSAEKIFERRWALTLLEQALDRLRQECTASGKRYQFEQLKAFLSGETADGAYAAPAAELRMKVEAVAVAVHRLRQRYRQLVEAEVAQTVASPAEARAEMHHLFAALTG